MKISILIGESISAMMPLKWWRILVYIRMKRQLLEHIILMSMAMTASCVITAIILLNMQPIYFVSLLNKNLAKQKLAKESDGSIKVSSSYLS